MFQSNIYYYVRIKEYIVSTQEMCLEKTYQDVPRQILKILANKSRRTKTYQEQSWKVLTNAQDSCACTRVLCMLKNPVHAQES